MFKKIAFVLRYIKYLLKSKSRYSVHSPFVYDLLENALLDQKHFYAFEQIEGARATLKTNTKTIEITDFGAGSRINKSNTRKIADIAKNTAKAPSVARILFRLVNYFQPKNMLELGTSLGISSLYQFLPNKKANFVTMEGCASTAKVASRVFEALEAEKIKIVTGNFNDTLAPTVEQFEKLDYVFFDGNHQKQPTLDYFEICFPKATENSLFVFDDIHWSAEMEEAWEIIKNDPRVTVTIDLFWIGLVFFKKDQAKENFVLRTTKF